MNSFFFFNDTATTEIYTLSLHDALPICSVGLVLFVARVAQGNLLLVVEPLLVVGAPAGVQDPLLEALAYPFEVPGVRFSTRAGEVADQVRVRPDEAIPEVQDLVDLILQDVTRQP